MKLIYCKKCHDVYNATANKMKRCSCGKTCAVYINDEDMAYDGKTAVCLGIDNFSLDTAIENQVVDGFACRFDAYIPAMLCGSTIKVKGLGKKTEKEIKEIKAIETVAFAFKESGKLRFIWDKLIEKKRSGIRTILYKFSKMLMNVRINKLPDGYLYPNIEEWQSDYTNRLLALSEKLAHNYEEDYKDYWFKGLLMIMKKNRSYMRELESITNYRKLYRRFSEILKKEIFKDEEDKE